MHHLVDIFHWASDLACKGHGALTDPDAPAFREGRLVLGSGVVLNLMYLLASTEDCFAIEDRLKTWGE